MGRKREDMQTSSFQEENAEQEAIYAEQQARALEELKSLDFSEENGGEFVGAKEIAQAAAEAGVQVAPEMLPQEPAAGMDQTMEQKMAAATLAIGALGPAGLMAMGITPPTPNDPSNS